ncbi:MAG: DUF4292 domain-containing protein, partial [Prevotella sp.]|nr:DUF4292 domain-containing protein [Prevotella sp.]
ALLWNSLYVPGTQKITDSSLKNFTVVSNDGLNNNLVSLKKGKMDYVWEADKTSGQIKAVNVTYTDKSSSTEFGCTYDSFKSLGTKNFPTDITLNLHSDAIKGTNTLSMKIAISSMDTSNDWETYTDVSNKYKQVSVQDVMKKLMSL